MMRKATEPACCVRASRSVNWKQLWNTTTQSFYPATAFSIKCLENSSNNSDGESYLTLGRAQKHTNTGPARFSTRHYLSKKLDQSVVHASVSSRDQQFTVGRILINELDLALKWSDMARKRVKSGLVAHSSSLPTADLDHFDVRRIGRFFLLTTSQGFENASHCLHPHSL